jgi:hypothetical protein
MTQCLLRHCQGLKGCLERKLGKDEDPETWITNVEDLLLKLEVMGLYLTDNQFMIQILNILSNEYELQILLLKKTDWN